MAGKRWLILMMAAVLLTASSCSEQAGPNGEPEPQQPDTGLPEEIEAWLEDSKDMFLAQSKSDGGKLYLLATYGEKPTGGYSVNITEVEASSSSVDVTVHFSRPGEDEVVTQALTYPYDLKVIDDPGLPVRFNAKGAESYLPTLQGIEELPPVKAGSRWIKIFNPAPGERVGEVLAVEGIANVFEGTVQYRLSTAEGKVLAEGFTTGAMGDWGYFSFDLAIPGGQGADLFLELYTLSPKDGAQENLVKLNLFLEGA